MENSTLAYLSEAERDHSGLGSKFGTSGNIHTQKRVSGDVNSMKNNACLLQNSKLNDID